MYPQEHCIKEQEIMRDRHIDEKMIHAVAAGCSRDVIAQGAARSTGN